MIIHAMQTVLHLDTKYSSEPVLSLIMNKKWLCCLHTLGDISLAAWVSHMNYLSDKNFAWAIESTIIPQSMWKHHHCFYIREQALDIYAPCTCIQNRLLYTFNRKKVSWITPSKSFFESKNIGTTNIFFMI